jgi:hypothetical protein
MPTLWCNTIDYLLDEVSGFTTVLVAVAGVTVTDVADDWAAVTILRVELLTGWELLVTICNMTTPTFRSVGATQRRSLTCMTDPADDDDVLTTGVMVSPLGAPNATACSGDSSLARIVFPPTVSKWW